jgi:chitinase
MFRHRIAVVVFSLIITVWAAPQAASAARKDRVAPTAPSNLVITATTATSVSLTWAASTDNSSTWWYCVQTNGSGCLRVNPPNTTLTWFLMPDRTYTFSVYAIDLAGNRSANSNTVSYTTPPDTTPPSPAPTLSATVYATRVHVGWTQARDNTSEVWYTLYADGSVVFADQAVLYSWTFLDLQPSSTHTYRVTARDAYFNVVESNLLTVTTPPKNDAVAPTVPTNLRFNFRSSTNELWLEWDLSTDNLDPQGAIIYYVYQNGVLTDAVGGGLSVTYCAEPIDTEVWLTAVDTSGNESGRSTPVFSPCV